jgi:hypothetical protein
MRRHSGRDRLPLSRDNPSIKRSDISGRSAETDLYRNSIGATNDAAELY